MGANSLQRQQLEPADERGLLALLLHGRHRDQDHFGRPVEGRGVDRVADRLRGVAVSFEPVARSQVQLVDVLGQLVEQPGAQHLGEEVVIAVPLAVVVERHEEEVRPVQRLEGGAPPLAPVTASHRSPVSRERIDVSSRNLRTASGCRCSTSSTR